MSKVVIPILRATRQILGRRAYRALGSSLCPSPPPPPRVWTPLWQLKGTLRGPPIVVSTGPEYAGAIASITWGGMEFIDPAGHGGQLQMATFLDGMGGDNNPTEAGCSADGDGPAAGVFPGNSTSTVLGASVTGNVLTTACHPAFWFPYQGRKISNDVFTKTVTLGYNGMEGVLQFENAVTFAEDHSETGITVLVGYFNQVLTQWHQYDPATKQTTQVSSPQESPGGKEHGPVVSSDKPMIASDPAGNYAISIFARSGLGYGYGWDGPYKILVAMTGTGAVKAGTVLRWEVFVVVGTRQLVADNIRVILG